VAVRSASFSAGLLRRAVGVEDVVVRRERDGIAEVLNSLLEAAHVITVCVFFIYGDVWLLGIRRHNLLQTFSIFYHGLHMR